MLDIIIILIAIFIKYFIDIINIYYIKLYWILGITQALTAYCIFLKPTMLENDKTGNIKTDKIIYIITTILIILFIGSFSWFFIPAMVIGNTLGWIIFRVNLFISIFGSLFSYRQAKIKDSINIIDKILFFISPILYLSFSLILICSSVHFGKTSLSLAIFALAISYLPVRLILLIRPPWNLLEIITITASIIFIIISLY